MNLIFHQTYKTEKLPIDEQKNFDKVEEIYPSCDHRLWTDIDIDNFVNEEFPNYYKFFNELSKIQRIDLVRYLWMYQFGGVYADLDIFFHKKIDFSEYDKPVFIEREWTHPIDHCIKTSVHNAIFYSPPKHPIWLTIINEIKLKHYKGITDVFNLTGPNSISEIITRLQLKIDIVVLPGYYIYQKGLSKHTGVNSYVTHYGYASWK